MMKKLLVLFAFTLSATLFAQDVERTKIAGKITAQENDDLEGITIYNQSSQKGTITDATGTFEIEVAENDRLYVTALQYQSFTILVDAGVVDKKRINIYLNPSVNQLEEVIVRPYDLSGNVRADVQKIPTYSIGQNWDLSYENLEYGYQFEPDAQTKIAGNAAEEALHGNSIQNGANILGILGGVAGLLFPNREVSETQARESSTAISTNLQQRFSRAFVAANFQIPEEKAVDFLYFAQENGLNQDLLRSNNEMQLMEFLREKSIEYKTRGE
ncbi:carboxypeptidase-like regulatory domain-containing protein [Aequorivita echinoideorum]|uniref:Carboxypeptidase-like regulatory domain-containing protein n=1 Tax=Aequorivita echinoideorum TaxID=1549647 RepID=A0ABS5S7F5_9FLAO|nr:carboxypeptidase-like regulatory domain-containing protein [Aequorivita echinoideorum]MBT0609114.1 carboxypeptidase-like regulatory domain-containing protein [Aequorivita echinoideorum]